MSVGGPCSSRAISAGMELSACGTRCRYVRVEHTAAKDTAMPSNASKRATPALVAPGSKPVDAAFVIARLETAGATLFALTGTVGSSRLFSSSIEIGRSALEPHDRAVPHSPPPMPSRGRFQPRARGCGGGFRRSCWSIRCCAAWSAARRLRTRSPSGNDLPDATLGPVIGVGVIRRCSAGRGRASRSSCWH